MNLNRQVLNRVNGIMNMAPDHNGSPTQWFYSFGTLLEYICDKTFSLNYDIDVGVLYSECMADQLISYFAGFQYKVTGMLLNDVTKQPLNIHFKSTEVDFKKTPTVDVYFWVEHKDLLLHTYDINRECKEIPSKYVFKGVKKSWIIPDPKIVTAYQSSGPENNQILNGKGVWTYDIFEDHGDIKFYCPYAYGHLLDEWYPGWRFRNYYKGQSKSRWQFEFKSCKQLNK